MIVKYDDLLPIGILKECMVGVPDECTDYKVAVVGRMFVMVDMKDYDNSLPDVELKGHDITEYMIDLDMSEISNNRYDRIQQFVNTEESDVTVTVINNTMKLKDHVVFNK